ncbi:MAG: cobalamin B12-binding domain-containing protein [Candidatus Rokubacteria bacterium]|nr:cobalamin B12-binding domain-containing protein [Candidatus Rokubacteria bacterium]
MRPLRVLIATLGLDQHEVGAVAVARQLRDAGMEVIYLGRFQLPPAIVKAAVDEAVDVIGLSCHSWEYLYYLDELMALLRARGLAIPVVLGGSVLTAADARALEAKGVAAAFGPTSAVEDIPATIERLARAR